MTSDKKEKLLVVTEVFAPEEFLVNDLVFHWKDEGRDVSVLTRNPSYPMGRIFPGCRNRIFTREKINGVQVHRVQFIPGYRENRFIKILNYLWNMTLAWIWALIHGRRYDRVFICQTGPLTFSSAGILTGRLYRKPVSIWSQDIWPDTVFEYGMARSGPARRMLECFVRWIYKGCSGIAVSSPGFIPILSNYAPQKEISFIPQWPVTADSAESESPEPAIALPGKFNFVFAGNIGKVQNLENVMRGFHRFASENGAEDVWLCLAGDGSNLDTLKALAGETGIQRVKFLGKLPLAHMPALYAQADVLIISLQNRPVFNQTIPAKFQSYLGAGKPIFGIIAGEVATLIEQHNLGWVADPDHIESIAGRFAEIVECSPEDHLEKIRNARQLLSNRFTREKSVESLTKIAFGPFS